MTEQERKPGQWPDISEPGVYKRLVGLAKRRLVGYESHAEDVVSRVLIKWSTIPHEKASVARIEQVVKTEAFSFLRSETRAKERDTRVARDPTSAIGRSSIHGQTGHELGLLRAALAETCKREKIPISTTDIEVIELLFAGHNLSSIARSMGISIYEVKKSRERWRVVCSLTEGDSLSDRPPPRTLSA